MKTLKSRRYLALLFVPLVLMGIVSAPTGASASRVSPGDSAQVVIDWQRIAIRTVYTEGLQPPPIGSLYLGFTALAVNDAVQSSLQRGNTSADAAVATAAHGVLSEYFSATSADNLDAALATTLDAIPDGAPKNKGIRIGEQAAAEMIASRVGDGRGDASIVYTVPDPIPAGVWAPVPTVPGGMLAPWLGFVDNLVVNGSVPVDGPNGLGSGEYTADYNEVKDVGVAAGMPTTRTADQTQIALFFHTSNPVAQLPMALCAYLEANPIGLERTAKLFATSAAATADTFIQTWRAKYEVRFWRPFEAIRRGGEDGNPNTAGDPATAGYPGWTPLVFPNPPYSDYLSGHGSAVSPFAASVRAELGDDTPLTLVGATGTTPRTYETLTALEHDTLNARIWAGLHFRDSMEDTYYVGHTNAQRVRAALG